MLNFFARNYWAALTFCVVLINTCVASGSDEARTNFSVPHFFTPTSGAKEKYLLRYDKGIAEFSKHGIAFKVAKSLERNRGFSEDFLTDEVTMEFVKMTFLGGFNECELNGIEPLSSVTNFITSENNESLLPNYNSLFYKNIYEGIDAKYYLKNNEIKYDFIVKAGAKASEIKMKYEGVKELEVSNDGALKITTTITQFLDYMPESYQVIDGRKIPVQVSYELLDRQTVGFRVTHYNENYDLIIDPALVYSSFVGGSGDDFEYTGGIEIDAAGNLYVTGRSLSPNFPVTTGTYQTTFSGNYDVFVFKMNPAGTALVFSTYVGGNSYDAGYTLKVDPVTNDIYVGGMSYGANFPTTAGSYQPVFGGGVADPIAFKLSANGASLIYSTFLGNAQDDYGASIEIDDLGNLYMVGQSSGPFPTTPGAFQTAYAGGAWDLFVLKLNPSGSNVIFSTMIGGPNTDHSHSIQVDSNYDIYIEGNAAGGFPTTPGAYDQTFNGGIYDIFVTKFNSTGTALIWSTYVGGSSDEHTWNGLEIDAAGNCYATGLAKAGFPTTPGAFQTAYGGGVFDAFVFKLDANGANLLYSSYFGGPGDDQGFGICLNPAGEAYITGLCSFGYPVTSCVYDTTHNGSYDLFVTYINSTGSAINYSSYYGGSSDDQGYNIANSGNFVYVAGATYSTNFPVTPGSYQTTQNGNRDVVVLKIDVSAASAPPVANFAAANSGCLNEPITFNNSSSNAVSYEWDFGDGNTDVTQNPTHFFSTPGNYDVKLRVFSGCNEVDSIVVPIQINASPVIDVVPAIQCGGDVTFTNNTAGVSSISWDFGDGTTSSAISPVHTYSGPGNYSAVVSMTNTNGCSDSILIPINVTASSQASFNATPASCSPSVVFQNTSTAASSFIWLFGDGTSDTSATPQHTYSNPGSYSVFLVSDPATCPDTATATIQINAQPTATFNSLPDCNLSVQLSSLTPGMSNYSWNFGDGGSGSGNTVTHTYVTPGNFPVTLIVTDANNCSDTLTQNIQVNPVVAASFTAPVTLCSGTINFLNQSMNATGYSWYFGDGQSSVQTNPSHDYLLPGSYNVMLVASAGNCVDTSQLQISVSPTPVASFNHSVHCGQRADFSDIGVGASQLNWDFGDGTTATGSSPSHQYPLPGDYFVTQVAVNAQGCMDTLVRMVSIVADPVASFNISSQPCDPFVSVTNTSINAQSYGWYFDSLGLFTAVEPMHEFNDSGYHQVTLIAASFNCFDTVVQQVYITPIPESEFETTTDCGLTVDFKNLSSGASFYQWDFGDSTSSNAISPAHTFSQTGRYSVNLMTSNAYGCTSMANLDVDVIVPSNSQFQYQYDTCLSRLQLLNLSMDASSYFWNMGDSTYVEEESPMHIFKSQGDYSISLVTNPNTSCADTSVQLVTIPETPESYLYIPNCFTPNGDGLNETFRVFAGNNCNAYKLLIYNRWGELVFETDDLLKGWDGIYKGNLVPCDVYPYLLYENEEVVHGSVTVMY